MGTAQAVAGAPKEIRVYTIHGPSYKDYSEWKPKDMSVDEKQVVCETLVHEIAHIHQTHHCKVIGHEQTFIAGYLAVERLFIELGFEPMLPAQNRFAGCPGGSRASLLAGTPRP